jgi:hypothetical protein
VARDVTRPATGAALAWAGLALAVGNAAAALLPEAGPARLPLALAFVTLGPGCALVAHARLGDRTTAWALAVVLSLAIEALVSATMAWTGWWQPRAGAVALAAVTAAACLAARPWHRT